MALIHQAEIQVARIYSPLTLSPGVTVEGNVPSLQQYDIATGLYEPDYTATHLRLHAGLDIVDPDGELPDGPARLANISWTLLEKGTETAITASTPGFAADADGDLIVKRNCDGIEPMTLRFRGEFLDTRTGQVHPVAETHLVEAAAVSERPVLSLDTSGLLAYDPVRDGEKSRKVKASLTIGGNPVAAANFALVWEKRDSDGIWSVYDPDDPMDCDLELSADGTELTVRLWLIGERIDVRCYARYSPYGNPSALAIDARTPVAEFAAVRMEKKLWGSVKGARRLLCGMKTATYELTVKDSKGVIPNPDEVLDIVWRVSTSNAGGTVTMGPVIARGSKVTIPTAFIAKKYGGIVRPSFGVKEPLALITVDGAALVSDGKAVVGRAGQE